jgi:hypothetical protein
MLRSQGRDLHAEFVRLLPSPPQPIRIQRWSARRIGLLALVAVLLAALGSTIAGSVTSNEAGKTPLYIGNLACADLEPLWLQAQAVPSASLVPCMRSRPPGWTLRSVTVNDGRSVFRLDHDRAGPGAVVMSLTASCDTAGTVETPSPPPGVRRYQRVDRAAGAFGATWYDRFPGGCVTYRLHSTRDVEGWFAAELPALLGFASRDELREALSQRSGGRLQLDTGPRRG